MPMWRFDFAPIVLPMPRISVFVHGSGISRGGKRKDTGEAAQYRGRRQNYGSSRTGAFPACDCLGARNWVCYAARVSSPCVCTPFQNSGNRFWNAIEGSPGASGGDIDYLGGFGANFAATLTAYNSPTCRTLESERRRKVGAGPASPATHGR
jgi:hypothetical protein